MAKSPRLSDKQMKFCEAYFATGHKRNAAKAAGYACPDQAAHRELQKEPVLDYLIDMIRKNQKAEALVAHKGLLELAQSDNQAIKLKACVELLNRSGLMIAQQHEHKHEVVDSRTTEELQNSVQALLSELQIKTIDAELVGDGQAATTPALVEQTAET